MYRSGLLGCISKAPYDSHQAVDMHAKLLSSVLSVRGSLLSPSVFSAHILRLIVYVAVKVVNHTSAYI